MKPRVLFLFILLRSFCYAQESSIEQAELFFETGQYFEALPLYASLVEKDTNDAEMNYRAGICYLHARSQKTKAIPFLKRALNSPDIDVGQRSRLHKLLADAYYKATLYDQATTHYESFKKLSVASRDWSFMALQEADKQIELCRVGKELKELQEFVTTLVNRKFTDTSNGSASAFSNYSSACSADQSAVTFTFKRVKEHEASDKDLFADSAPPAMQVTNEKLDTSTEIKEATVATSVDGQILLTYRDENGDGNLYTSMLNGNDWTTPERLSRKLNDEGWEQNEFITPDGNTLYFTSSRAGGYGGKDIYKCVKQADGTWSRAVNLGYPVNSAYDEEAPFMHSDGVTLYFSSNRLKENKKYFDLYTSTFSDSGWAKPASVGYPVHQKKFFYVSKRTMSSDKLKEKENYLVTFTSTHKPPLTLVKGQVIDKEDEALPGTKITVYNNETAQVTGVYFTGKDNGQYIFILPPGANSNVTFQAPGYLFHSENMDITDEAGLYKLNKPVKLVPLAVNSKEVLNNIFFKEDHSLHPASQAELNNLFMLLKENPGISVGLACSTEKRAQGIINYLVERGIDKERLYAAIYQRKKSRKENENAQGEKVEIKITHIKNEK